MDQTQMREAYLVSVRISIVSEYTGNNYEERWSKVQPRGPMQVFKSRGI